MSCGTMECTEALLLYWQRGQLVIMIARLPIMRGNQCVKSMQILQLDNHIITVGELNAPITSMDVLISW